ncbi:hypothetical protein OJ933_10985, partial [Streptococcus anginosus]
LPSGLTVTPCGASLPSSYFVPSGAGVVLPSLPVNSGWSTFTDEPGVPTLSLYFGSTVWLWSLTSLWR